MVLSTLESLYGDLFRVPAEVFELLAVRRVGKTTTGTGDKVYHFVAIVSAPCDHAESFFPDKNEFTRLRNEWVRTRERGCGVEFVEEVRWKAKDKHTGKRRKKRFHFMVRLSPVSVLDFEVAGGMYLVRVECYGLFY